MRACLAILTTIFLLSPAVAREEEFWRTYNDSGWAAYKQGKLADARKLFQAALKEAESDTDSRRGFTLTSLALVAYREGKSEEVGPYCQKALQIFAKSPADSFAARGYNTLGLLYQDQQRYADAEKLYKAALAIEEATQAKESLARSQVLMNLGRLYVVQRKLETAEPLLRLAVAIQRKALENTPVVRTQALDELAACLRGRGDFAEAERLLKESVAIRQTAQGKEHLDLAPTLAQLASLYEARRRFADAEATLRQVLAIREKGQGTEHLDVATTCHSLARVCHGQKKYKEAEELANRALAIREKELGKEHRVLAATLHLLGNVARDQGKDTAEASYRRAIAVLEKAGGGQQPSLAPILDDYAALLRSLKRTDDANALSERARRIREMASKSEIAP
ncbi:MAG: tetratricopeptide repeat protein [Gemmataceae bacterium]|nr:tetratricopeptide repeat protein [Gemmataceae bacterium]